MTVHDAHRRPGERVRVGCVRRRRRTGDRRCRRSRARPQPGPLRPRPCHHHFRYRSAFHQPGCRFPGCRPDNRIRRGHRDPFPVRDHAVGGGPQRGPRSGKVAVYGSCCHRCRRRSPDRAPGPGPRPLLGHRVEGRFRQLERPWHQRAKVGPEHFHGLLDPLRNDGCASGDRGRGGRRPRPAGSERPKRAGPATPNSNRAPAPGRRPDAGQAVPSGRAPATQSAATHSAQSAPTQSAGLQSSATQVAAPQESHQTGTAGR